MIASFFIIGFGYNFKYDWIFYFGILLLGIAAAGRGIIRFIVTRRDNSPRKMLAKLSDYYVALAQIFIGALILFGVFAEIYSNSVSSGKFWQNIVNVFSPFIIFFIIGCFLPQPDFFQIFGNEKSDEKTIKTTLEYIFEIAQGIVPFIFGLFLMGLIIFLWLYEYFYKT